MDWLLQWVDVDVYNGFICGAASDGGLQCMGDAVWEWFGVGTTYTQVAVGADYESGYWACGLRTDGEIECYAIWRVPDLPDVAPGPFTRIEGGAQLSGIHESGLLYDMIRGSFHTWAEFYVDVDNSGFGYATECAVRVEGDIECQGWNAYLGDLEPPAVYTKVAVDQDANAVCGLTDLGEILCWGDPYPGTPPPVGPGYVDLSMDNDVGCAIAADGSATCWGADDESRYPP